MTWWSKFWSWVKRNWQWVVGLATLFLSAVVSRRIRLEGSTAHSLEELAVERDMQVAQVNELRDAKLKELADRHQERLGFLSNEQETELEDLAEKPIEEVVAWFDKL